MTTLRAFLDSRRVAKDDTTWNLTGMGRNDAGKYYVSNNDYDELLRLHHDHIFVNSLPSSLGKARVYHSSTSVRTISGLSRLVFAIWIRQN